MDTERRVLQAVLTFTGGLAHVLSLSLIVSPSLGHPFGPSVELLLVAPLTLWQARIAAKSA